MDSLQHLLEVIPAHWFAERACVVDMLKEFTSHDWLLGDESYRHRLAVFLGHNGLLLELKVPHYVLVSEAYSRLNFFFEHLYEVLIIRFLRQVKDLESVLLTIWSVGKLDFGAETFA